MRRNTLFVGASVALAAVLVFASSVSIAQGDGAKKAEADSSKMGTTTATKAVSLTPGDRCTGDPKFLEKLGMSKRAMVDTTSTHRIGLVVTDVTPQGQPGRSQQHESWAQAGYLGRVQRDKEGNIYTYPAPSVTLVYNPVEKANIIYRVESETGVMAPFVELPKEAPATERNPFGLLSLTLDCEQQALYASSVYGSTSTTEKGVIARIDLKTKEVKIVKRGIDALSLLVAFDERGKRLYAGASRDNAVVSYGFKKDGTLADDETVEIKLDDVKSAQDKRARVLRVDGRGRMYVRAIPFEYTLNARATIPTAEMIFVKSEKSGKLEVVDEKVTDVATRTLSPQQNPTNGVDAPK
jgi:hypothetical protein